MLTPSDRRHGQAHPAGMIDSCPVRPAREEAPVAAVGIHDPEFRHTPDVGADEGEYVLQHFRQQPDVLLQPDAFTVRELDTVKVKGKNEPVTIYELVGYDTLYEQQQPLLTKFGEGLAAYKQRQWTQASACFQAATPGNAGKSEGWMLRIRDGNAFRRPGLIIRIKPARAMTSAP